MMATSPTSNLTNMTDSGTNITSLPTKPGLNALYAVGVILTAVAILCIIAVNGIFLVCFYINREKRWVIFSKNISSLVVIDLLVGLSAFVLMTAAFLKTVNFYFCVTAQVLSMSSQVATTLNVFRICILRFIATKKSKQVQSKPSTISVVVQTSGVYIAALLLISVPMFVWAVFSPNLDRCNWSLIFQDNSSMADTYILIVIILPAVFTTILYSLICWELRHIKRIVPTDSHEVPITRLVNSHRNQPPNENIHTTKDTNTKRISQGHNMTSSSLSHGPMDKSQERFSAILTTIGLILICVNISILPFIIVLVVKINIFPTKVDGLYAYFASFTLLLNSAINPAIYAIRIKQLRESFIALCLSLCRCRRLCRIE